MPQVARKIDGVTFGAMGASFSAFLDYRGLEVWRLMFQEVVEIFPAPDKLL